MSYNPMLDCWVISKEDVFNAGKGLPDGLGDWKVRVRLTVGDCNVLRT
jgi:hypothetical protein